MRAINTLKVIINPTTIKVKPVIGFKCQTVNLTANLNDYYNKPVKYENVQFTVNGKLVGTALTNSKGTATLSYKILQNIGIYKILAIFNGNENYGVTSANNTLKVNLTPTTIKVKPLIGFKGQTVILTVTLKDKINKKLIQGKTVKCFINGKLIGRGITNSKGIAKIKYKIKQKSGKYKILAIFNGDKNYGASRANNTLKVNLTPTAIKVKPVSGFKGKTVILTSILKDILYKKLIRGKTIKCFINGKLIGRGITNSKGIAKIKYKIKQNRGKYNIKYIFAGDKFYKISKSGSKLFVR
jgi:hypothetical protein